MAVIETYKVERHNGWREAYFTLRMFGSMASVWYGIFNENKLAIAVSCVFVFVWCIRANNECLKP